MRSQIQLSGGEGRANGFMLNKHLGKCIIRLFNFEKEMQKRVVHLYMAYGDQDIYIYM